MYQYIPNEAVVDRAVELWKRMLRNPKYDNLGTTRGQNPEETCVNEMASMMAMMIPNNSTEELLTKFGEALKRRLLQKNKHDYYENSLHVDYGPDPILHESAEEAGLKIEFPWKTGMWLGDSFVSVSYGYGAEQVYHHLMPGGKWLVTRLSGSDIGKVIEYVNGGKPEFVVE